MRLITPTIKYDAALQAFRAEFLHPGMSMDGGGSLIRYDDTAEWLKRVELISREETVPEGHVAATQYIYVREDDGKVVGVIQIRHSLATEEIAKYSGHIGYSVAPSERLKGYASQMLALALKKCREFGIHRVLICCVKGNEGSRRTILKNGGVYESTVYQAERDRYLERYWVDLSAASL